MDGAALISGRRKGTEEKNERWQKRLADQDKRRSQLWQTTVKFSIEGRVWKPKVGERQHPVRMAAAAAAATSKGKKDTVGDREEDRGF